MVVYSGEQIVDHEPLLEIFFYHSHKIGFDIFHVNCPNLQETIKKSKRKIQGVPQSQATALPRHEEEEETDKTKQAQSKQTYEKHKISSLVPKRGNCNA